MFFIVIILWKRPVPLLYAILMYNFHNRNSCMINAWFINSKFIHQSICVIFKQNSHNKNVYFMQLSKTCLVLLHIHGNRNNLLICLLTGCSKYRLVIHVWGHQMLCRPVLYTFKMSRVTKKMGIPNRRKISTGLNIAFSWSSFRSCKARPFLWGIIICMPWLE